jgi:hypothetical protein
VIAREISCKHNWYNNFGLLNTFGISTNFYGLDFGIFRLVILVLY